MIFVYILLIVSLFWFSYGIISTNILTWVVLISAGLKHSGALASKKSLLHFQSFMFLPP